MVVLLHSAVNFLTLAYSKPASVGHKNSEVCGNSVDVARHQFTSAMLRRIGNSSIGSSLRGLEPEISRRIIRVRMNSRSQEMATVRSVPVQVAHELLNAGHRYLDVRTTEEFVAGHPDGAINVPYLLKAGSGMTKNLRFIEEVAKHFDKDSEVVVGCQSGKRSIMATTELQVEGFTGVTDMGGGYSAWVEGGLPVKIQ